MTGRIIRYAVFYVVGFVAGTAACVASPDKLQMVLLIDTAVFVLVAFSVIWFTRS